MQTGVFGLQHFKYLDTSESLLYFPRAVGLPDAACQDSWRQCWGDRAKVWKLAPSYSSVQSGGHGTPPLAPAWWAQATSTGSLQKPGSGAAPTPHSRVPLFTTSHPGPSPLGSARRVGDEDPVAVVGLHQQVVKLELLKGQVREWLPLPAAGGQDLQAGWGAVPGCHFFHSQYWLICIFFVSLAIGLHTLLISK